MEKSMLEILKEGDAVSVALRGGAGWVHGALVWRREGMMLLDVSNDSVLKATPFVVVLLADVSAIALPSKVDPPGEGRAPGFNR